MSLDAEHAARANVIVERGHCRCGVAQVREEKPRVHHVELREGRHLADVSDAKLHVGDAVFRGFRARQVDLGLVEVDADDRATRSDLACQVERCVAAATADVEAGQTVHQAEPIEQRQRARAHDSAENAKPFSPLEPAANDVVRGVCHGDA
jgi:hypothetical protein